MEAMLWWDKPCPSPLLLSVCASCPLLHKQHHSLFPFSPQSETFKPMSQKRKKKIFPESSRQAEHVSDPPAYVFPVCMCMMCVLVGSPECGVTDGYEASRERWEPNPSLLQEQPVLFSIETPIQSPRCYKLLTRVEYIMNGYVQSRFLLRSLK